MNQTVISQIDSKIESFTKLQKKIANYVLSDPIQTAFMTVDQLAHAVGVSTATVVRFSVELGYSGYAEFQENLQDFLKSKAKPSAKLQVNIDQKSTCESEQNNLIMCTQLVIDNINRTFEGISEENLNRIVDCILHASRIYCAGVRTSACVSTYLGYNLGRMLDAPCLICSDNGNMPELVRQMNEGDVVFAITMSRYSRFVVEFARLAKKNNATVIAFTDEFVSPLSQYSDFQLVAKTASDGFHNSVVAFCYLIDILLSMCCKQVPEQISKNLKASERIITEMSLMIDN